MLGFNNCRILSWTPGSCRSIFWGLSDFAYRTPADVPSHVLLRGRREASPARLGNSCFQISTDRGGELLGLESVNGAALVSVPHCLVETIACAAGAWSRCEWHPIEATVAMQHLHFPFADGPRGLLIVEEIFESRWHAVSPRPIGKPLPEEPLGRVVKPANTVAGPEPGSTTTKSATEGGFCLQRKLKLRRLLTVALAGPVRVSHRQCGVSINEFIAGSNKSRMRG